MVIHQVHPVNPQKRFLENAVTILQHGGGIAVYPTDTVYGMGAAVSNAKSLNFIATMMNKDKGNLFSFLCCNFAQMSEYVHVSTAHYRLIKHYLPGPYTFILPATNLVPKRLFPKRRTVGIRIPNCPTLLGLIELLGEPIANISVPLHTSGRGTSEAVAEAVEHYADVMLDTGPLDSPEGSTIVDLTDTTPVLIRLGKGAWNE